MSKHQTQEPACQSPPPMMHPEGKWGVISFYVASKTDTLYDWQSFNNLQPSTYTVESTGQSIAIKHDRQLEQVIASYRGFLFQKPHKMK